MKKVFCLLRPDHSLLSVHATMESMLEVQRLRKALKQETVTSEWTVDNYRAGYFNDVIAEEEARQMQEQGQG